MNQVDNVLQSIASRIGELTTAERNMIGDLHAEISRRRNAPVRYGLVAALPKELSAIKAALDNYEEEYSEASNILYYRGKIVSPIHGNESHEIIVATTIKMGNSAAAIAVTSLVKDFPALTDVIMVGIAGGVPGEQGADDDVRLGDIVVSNGRGVVQYDMRKVEEGKDICRDQSQPPSNHLLSFVGNLESERRLGRRPWEAHIQTIASKTENGRRPEDQTDQRQKLRSGPETDPRRLHGQPVVHTGMIGSANILLKSEKVRNRLKKEHKILAVEMEGSGIADASWTFRVGYLLVRGICDYCDKSKNDIWQEYAAAAAAGYMRALIEKVPVKRVSIFDKLSEPQNLGAPVLPAALPKDPSPQPPTV
jgi:nucleoside phosphorylase